MGKTSSDVLSNPTPPPSSIGGGEARPQKFDRAYDALTATHGPMLQMMTRTTPAMRQLEDTAFILRYRFCSDYIGERLNEVERLAVSEDGHGRTDIIDVVKASGKDRDDEFTRKATFSFISEDE